MNHEKSVDESWKDSVKAEKDKITDSSQSGEGEHSCQDDACKHTLEMTFLNYITSLGFQAMIFLGEIPNPLTNEIEKNLNQAKLLIDTMAMLKDKTNGNLEKQESDMMNATLYQLQMKYVELSKDESKNG